MKAAPWILLVAACVSACHRSESRPLGGRFGPDGVARVDGDTISRHTVERIAEAQGVSQEQALDEAVRDALWAAAARAAPGGARSARFARRSALARGLLESLHAQAVRQGPPSDEAIRQVTQARWWELDRPELRRCVHAVALVKRPEDRAAALDLARAVAHATKGISDPAQFAEAAQAVGGNDDRVELRVEPLQPVAADGRVVDPAQPPPPGAPTMTFDRDFAKAVFDIPSQGDISPVVDTQFGFHVILFVDRIEPRKLSLEERRALLSPELMAARADKLEEDLITRLRSQEEIDVERSALELTKQVVVRP